MEFFLIAKIVIRKSLVDARDARDFVHSRPGQPPLREHLSRGHHNAPNRREMTPFPKNPPSDGRKFPVLDEIRLRFGFSFGFDHFPTEKM